MLRIVKKLLPVLMFGAGAAMLLAGGKKRRRGDKPEEPAKLPDNGPSETKVYVFEASWCEYCKKAKPALEQVAKNHPDIDFQFVDFDEEKDLVKAYDVKALPTVVAVVNGQVVRRIEGAGDVKEYGEMAEEVARMASGAIPLPAVSPDTKKLPPAD